MNRNQARQVLGLAPGDGPAEVERAFKQRAREAHPDVGGAPGEFEQLQEARRILTEPVVASNVVIVRRPPWPIRKWKAWRRAPRVQ